MRKSKKVLVASVAAALGLGTLVAVSHLTNSSKFGFEMVVADEVTYSFDLDATNKPTESASFTSATSSVVAPDNADYNLEFAYSNVKAGGSSVHGVLADGSTIKRVSNEALMGFNAIQAHYTGGKLFVKFGRNVDKMHWRLLPNDGTKLDLPEGFTFNVFELEAIGEVSLEDAKIFYNCQVTDNPEVTGITKAFGEAVVNGIDDDHLYGEEEIFHVKAKGDGEISKVILNGKELQADGRFGDGYYSYFPSPNDDLRITTTVDEASDVTVGVYAIDETTGAVSPIGTGSYVVEAADVDYTAEWYAKIDAPAISGYTIGDGYYPNQDYVKFEKGTVPTNIKFYYSKLATGDGTASASLAGSGTELDPYLISSVGDWLYLVDNGTTENSSGFYKMTKSLDLSGVGADRHHMFGNYPIKPVNGPALVDDPNKDGDQCAQIFGDKTGAAFFTGTFDGNGCAIRGMHVKASNVTNVFAEGVFAVVASGATVKNLSSYGTINSTESHSRAGGIAGYNCGLIENCQNYISFTRNAPNAGPGGIAGDMNGTGAAIARNCTNYGSITCTNTTANVQAGGIVGFLTCDGNDILISGCRNFGNISNSGCIFGGLLGDAQYIQSHKLTVENCQNFGNLSGTRAWMGGIAGYTGNATVTNAENFGNVFSTNNAGGNGEVSGCIARATRAATFENVDNYGKVVQNGAITSGDQAVVSGVCSKAIGICSFNECDNFGDVSYESTRTAYYIGGVLGWANGATAKTLTNCNNFGNVTSAAGGGAGGLLGYISNSAGAVANISDCINIGSISGATSNVGGMVGESQANSVLHLENCTNTGFIYCETNDVGGIVGLVRNASTTIETCGNYGRISAANYAGGIVGDTGNDASTITIDSCFNECEFIEARTGSAVGNICARPHLD